MARICQVTGKKTRSGNNVSHANNKTRRKFLPNLHTHRIWVESQNRYVKLRLSKKGLRTIDKLGIDHVLSNIKQHKCVRKLNSYPLQKLGITTRPLKIKDNTQIK